jgi:hypothetical protein
MPVRNQNWYDLQAGRRYPLDDSSTGLDDAGAFIDDSILVDCHIRFPNNLGVVAFVQAITVSNTLVTVLIGTADAAHTQNSIRTIAAINIAKPVQLNKNYPVTALANGVAGWLVFGNGIKTDFTARYATPAQTLILPRCARAYRPLPIPTMGKLNLDTALSGIVDLEAIAPVVAERKTMFVGGKAVDAIEFRLDGNLTNVDYNPYEYFLGECGSRPESGTCPKPPIETINGVSPDCNGNITITGEGISVYPFIPEGGIGLDIPLGLDDVCDKRRYDPPRQGSDICISSSSSRSSSSSTAITGSSSRSSSSTATPTVSSSSSIADTPSPSVSSSSSSSSHASLPFCQPFTGNLSAILTTVSGRFTARTQQAPEKCTVQISSSSSAVLSVVPTYSSSSSSATCGFIECGGTSSFADCGLLAEPGYSYRLDCDACECVRTALSMAPLPLTVPVFLDSSSSSSLASSSSSSSSRSSSSSSSAISAQLNQQICASDDIFATNIGILKNYPTDWAANRRISTEFKITPGITNNAGLVFNYLPPTTATGSHTYLVAAVDADRGTFMLLRYNGSAFVAEYTLSLASANFALDVAQWHKITVTPVITAGTSGVSVTCRLANSAGTRSVSFSVVVNNYGAPMGASGIFADRAYTYFNNLTVE